MDSGAGLAASMTGSFGIVIRAAAAERTKVNAALGAGISWMTGAIYGLAAESACDAVNNGDDWTISLEDLDLDVPDFLDIHAVFVCDEVGSEETGQHWSVEVVDDIEEVEVTMGTELVCTDWHIEIVQN